MSPVFDCTTPQGLADALPKVVEGVRRGDLVVLPTDTVYGIGADAFRADGVSQLLAAKGRGREMPPPVLVADRRMIDGLATGVKDWALSLIDRYWPGPLTLVLTAQPSLSWDLGETGGTVALRMPDDEIALAILQAVGPMAVSSANRTGNPASRTVLDAAAQLGAAVYFYLDGGPSRGGLASTIVDCTGDEPVVLREGAIPAADIHATIAEARRPSTPDAEVGSEDLELAEVSATEVADDPHPPAPADQADPLSADQELPRDE